MKLTILGSGTCASGIPGVPNRYPPAFLLEWGGVQPSHMLFECSEGMRFRLESAGYPYEYIAHIAVSHAHPDHYALPQFLQSVLGRFLYVGEDAHRRRIRGYCPPQIANEFWLVWRHYTPEWQAGDEAIWPRIEFAPLVEAGQSGDFWVLDHARLLAYRVYHGFGRMEAFAFRLETDEHESFVYSGDTGDCAAIRSATRDADLLLIECSARIGNNKTPYEYGHLNPYLVGEIAKNAGVKCVVLFHYTGLDPDEALVAEVRRADYEGELIVGRDGQVIEF